MKVTNSEKKLAAFCRPRRVFSIPPNRVHKEKRREATAIRGQKHKGISYD